MPALITVEKFWLKKSLLILNTQKEGLWEWEVCFMEEDKKVLVCLVQ